ncbi:phosphatase PAP2 family protein [Collinsella sp. An2]|uniref:phosphatase PAP2 family protein n=1 Tax=Collinsella sp. An2 TaxID=1965585 RepID=UPI00130274B3|nr:phosphatase PAP2 family protein [Collinsella sp. An2]
MDGLELALLHGIQTVRSVGLDAFMVAVSSLANGGLVWIVLGLALLPHRRTRPVGVAVLLALVASELVCDLLLKNIVMRPRPCMIDQSVDMLVACPTSWSFPSGHAARAFAAAAALASALPKGWRRASLPAFAFAVLVGFSRLYLFVHFPTDVLVGALIGAVLGLLAARAAQALFGLARKA